ncbi:hypothetical protein [Variovorax boronicumulans]|uniref:hypothetical protein n=1 Tax=Variovorax boronicumulans TaxID=436515 RepID=UPI0012FDBF8F|nr:hypothetical protein [Variovorax boronicumulans]
MEALLGEGARFSGSEKTIDLRGWIGCGIDTWVRCSIDCLKRMLLSGVRQTSTVYSYKQGFLYFLRYLTEGRDVPRATTPSDLSPIHIHEFIGWLRSREQAQGWRSESTRFIWKSAKAMLLEMFAQGFILGEPTRFFKRATLPFRIAQSSHTSLSEAEQVRLAHAIKMDLINLYQGRLVLNPMDVQALRFLLVAHRQGRNLAPLLELRRDALAPGLLPGTVRIQTAKWRSKTRSSSLARASGGQKDPISSFEEEIAFSLTEGAVVQQAITSSEELVADAPQWCKSRVWLYRSSMGGTKRGVISCLTRGTLRVAILALVDRHGLLDDDGRRLQLNLSRLRKSHFDRAFRLADGDLVITANLLGNTPVVAASNYSTMNTTRTLEAAGFMNEDYLAMMRASSRAHIDAGVTPRVVEIRPLEVVDGAMHASSLERTPVSHCKDSIGGEYAPRDGHHHCDRYVMCLFCSSCAVVGTVDELWRLFSFQEFSKEELSFLDKILGDSRIDNEDLQDLRDRYRLAIPYIDDFTKRQFPESTVAQAKLKTKLCLHPFWKQQMDRGRRARFHIQDPLISTDREPSS